jgi:very-long-chain (3R)-3-hydroxyacyl-CoA dehydratase
MANWYLVLYNLASAAAWLYIFVQVAQSYAADKSPSALYKEIADPLMIVQTSMTLEIFHSLFGLVRSPVMTNVIQVGSRLAVLWIYLVPSVASQSEWTAVDFEAN